MTKHERALIIARISRLIWSSYETHLIDKMPLPKKKCCRVAVGGLQFHDQACQEYAEAIYLLNKLR